MPVKCPNCGRVSPDRTAFCAGCGAATWPPPADSLITEEEAGALASDGAGDAAPPASTAEAPATDVEGAWEAMVQARHAARTGPRSPARWTYVGLALVVGMVLTLAINLVGSRFLRGSEAGGAGGGGPDPAQPGKVLFARAVDPDGRPLREVGVVHAGDPSPVCVVELPGRGGQRRARSLSLRWTRDGVPVQVYPQRVPLPESAGEPVVFPVGLPPDAEPGKYAIEASLGDQLVAADILTVLPPGS